jgi:gamma-glutamylcyclotransferase (GGCT)/AIG2-like uncharacterized protein YtfP
MSRVLIDQHLAQLDVLKKVGGTHRESVVRQPNDPTIREKFDTYRFANHKEKVIDLLRRVTRLSVETVRIVAAMKGAVR